MFAQRFIESFRVKDRKAITNGTNLSIAATSKISGVICMPNTSPSIIPSNTPGSISINIVMTNAANVINSHSTEIFIFQSSRIPRPYNNVINICDSKAYKLYIYINALKKDKQKLVSTNEVCKEALTYIYR